MVEPRESVNAAAVCSAQPSRVLIVDDDQGVSRMYEYMLRRAGYVSETANTAEEALRLFERSSFDVVLSDITLPGMSGVEMLKGIRERDLDVPVILVTGMPSMETAVRAVEYGALRYLVKPASTTEVLDAVQEAIRLYRIAQVKRQALMLLGHMDKQIGDVAGLEASFDQAMQGLSIHYQPITCWSSQQIVGCEALVRSSHPVLGNPEALLDAAERLGQLWRLGQVIRDMATRPLADWPETTTLFVNIHAKDLLDQELYRPSSALSLVARRVVIELTERASLDQIPDARARIASLRKLGFRVAVDDLGAGYAGLTSFALLEPDIVKLDMGLVRGIDKSRTKQELVRSMVSVSNDLGIMLISEGVETISELRTLVSLGCDVFQGFLFARPSLAPARVEWPALRD